MLSFKVTELVSNGSEIEPKTIYLKVQTQPRYLTDNEVNVFFNIYPVLKEKNNLHPT